MTELKLDNLLLEERMHMLQGPCDEQRLRALQNVTRIKANALDAKALRDVAQAVDPAFLDSLLSPLQFPSSKSAGSINTETREGVALGLAILATLCQSPDMAAEPSTLTKVALCIKVVRAGGISQLISKDGPEPSPPNVIRSKDEAAVREALECLVLISSASEVGREAVVESGGLEAAGTALQALALGAAPVGGLPLQLLMALLGGPNGAAGFAPEHAEALSSAIVALASILCAVVPQPAKGKKLASAAAPDPRALQLEALPALLQLLPPLEASESAIFGRLASLLQSGGAAWQWDTWRGLGTMLGSRLGPAQRQASLQLAARMVALQGDAWLLGPQPTQPHQQRDAAGRFFTVLVELLKVETQLALQDALTPDIPLHPTPQPTAATKPDDNQTNAEQGSSSQGGPSAQEADEGLGPLPEPESRVGPGFPSSGAGPSSGLSEAAPDGSGARAGPAVGVGPPARTTGERAAMVVPVCCALLEACVATLVAVEEEGEHQQLLSGAALDRAFASLQESFRAVLQFLEEVAAHGGRRRQQGALEATRALGRFLADCPEWEQRRVCGLLPFLLQLDAGAAACFVLPFLLVATTLEAGPAAGAAGTVGAALLQPQVLALLVGDLSRHGELAAAAVVSEAEGGQANRQALKSEESALQTACQLLANLAGPRLEEQAGLLTPALHSLAYWSAARQDQIESLGGAGSGVCVDLGLVLAAARVCAVGLTAQRPQLGASLDGPEMESLLGLVLWGVQAGQPILECIAAGRMDPMGRQRTFRPHNVWVDAGEDAGPEDVVAALQEGLEAWEGLMDTMAQGPRPLPRLYQAAARSQAIRSLLAADGGAAALQSSHMTRFLAAVRRAA